MQSIDSRRRPVGCARYVGLAVGTELGNHVASTSPSRAMKVITRQPGTVEKEKKDELQRRRQRVNSDEERHPESEVGQIDRQYPANEKAGCPCLERASQVELVFFSRKPRDDDRKREERGVDPLVDENLEGEPPPLESGAKESRLNPVETVRQDPEESHEGHQMDPVDDAGLGAVGRSEEQRGREMGFKEKRPTPFAYSSGTDGFIR